MPGKLFVGREPELRTLREHVAAVHDGRGSLVLVSGEPGIGKTRLVELLAEEAAAQETRILWGRCFDGEGTPAFWPWVQLVRAYEHDHDSAADQIGQDASSIGNLLWGVHRDGDVAAQSLHDALRYEFPAEAAQARFELFDAIATWLGKLASVRPLLLVFDDLHWADAASLLVLRFIVHTLPDARICIIGTYRDTEATEPEGLRQLAADTARLPSAHLIKLLGLSEAETDHLLAETSTLPISPDVVHAVHSVTEGNPFFVHELVRALAADGQVAAWLGGSQLHPAPLSVGVRAVIDHRLERLAAECVRTLTAAAVIGREFGLATLRRVPDLFDAPHLALLEQAESAQIITPVSGFLGRYRFTHALIRETLYARLGSAQRARLHQQVGQALVSYYALDPEPHLAELAHHFVQAAPIGDAAVAVQYARRAAERAASQLAFEEAVRLYRLALEANELAPSPDNRLRCDVLLALADAQIRAGNLGNAEATARQAVSTARAIADAERFAQAVLALSERWGSDYGREDRAAIALIDEALAMLAGSRPTLQARLMVRQGRLLMFAGDCAAAAAISREAIGVARAAQEPHTLLHVLARAYWQLSVDQSPAECAAAANEVLDLAEQLGNQTMLLEGRQYRLCAALEAGDIARVDAELDRYTRLAQALQQPLYWWMAESYRAMRALLEGRFGETQRLAHRAAALATNADAPEASQVLAAQIGLARWLEGRAAELVEPTRQLCQRDPGIVAWRAMLAVLYCEVGATDAGRKEFMRLVDGGCAGLPRDTGWWATLACLSEVCALLNDEAVAIQLYALLQSEAGRVLVGPFGVFCLAPATYYLGLLATAAGWHAVAAQHFEAAAETMHVLGARPWLARLRHAQARLHAGSGQTEAGERPLAIARTLAAEARQLAEELGMHGLRDRVTALLAELEPPTTALLDGLTPRERDVLRLLASGRSNRDIADELVLSVHTVTRHIANIYGKLGLRSRSEATAYALRHGLA
jgi:DNA-binding CsgD family transcriptional regulator